MIQDLKDLKALFKLCRAQGVLELKMNGIELKLGNLPTENTTQESSEYESEMISDDKLLYWSTPQGQAELDQKVGMK
jgi:hypothetical protein